MDKTDYLYLFTQLPCINIYEEGEFTTCPEDEGYIPQLYKYEGKYGIDWVSNEGDSIKYITDETPQKAIQSAFNWCVENKLISIN